MEFSLDILLIVLAVVFLVLGILGSLLPIPGPPLSLLGLFLVDWTSKYEFSTSNLLLFSGLTLAVTLLDYLLPAWGLKKFGGSKWGVLGSTAGLFIGIPGGIPGILTGAFLGGLIGEFIAGQNSQTALKASIGSFVGFLFGTLLKLVLSLWMLWVVAIELFS